MTEQERFIVSIDNKNGVGLYDGDIRLLYFQFNNIQDATECKDALKHQCSLMNELHEENEELKRENEELKQEKKKILDTINNKITEKGMNWYKAEDNSKEEKEANIQLNVLEEIKDEIKKLNEDDKMRWSKKTENTVQDIDGEEYNIDEIVGALNHYQKSVDSLSKENYDMYCLIEEFCLNAKDMIMTFRERRKNND